MRAIKRMLQRLIYVSGMAKAVLALRDSAPTILMYHGVTDNAPSGLRNCDGKHVTRKRFVSQLRFLSRHRSVISLTNMVEGLYQGKPLHNTIAITFDDGYENNYSQAASLLADYKMNATFFLATGYIGTDRWMWTDRLESLLDRTERGTVNVPGMSAPVSLATREEKRRGLYKIKAHLKSQPNESRKSCIAWLARELVDSEEAPQGDYRFMNWQQARELSRAGFEVGAHTANHPILSQIDRAQAFTEILDSRDRIRTEIGKCSDVFCYPNGKSADYTHDITDFCRKHFRAALSSNRGTASYENLYELKRIGVSDSTDPSRLAWALIREQ